MITVPPGPRHSLMLLKGIHMRIWQTVLVYAAAAAVLFVYRQEITGWMLHSHPSAALMFLLALLFVMIPVIPYKIVIGLLGFMYGPLLGAFISWLAASIASIAVYLFVRRYFQQRGRAYIARFTRLEKLTANLERRPFLTIFLARMIPVFPQALVNIYPAFLSTRLLTYITASSLGKIPAMLTFAYLGKNAFTDLSHTFVVLAIYILFLLGIFIVYRLWLQKRAGEK